MSYDPVKAADKGDYYAEEQVPVQNCELQKSDVDGVVSTKSIPSQVYKKTWNLGIISTVGIVVALANFSICIWIRLELLL